MTDELIEALADCLRAMEAGDSLEAALAGYPALAGDLRPLLEAARSADRDLAVPRHAQMDSRAQFLAHAAELRGMARLPARPGRGFLARALSTGLAFLLGFVAGTYGVVAASAQSLPGDQLYGIKRAAEDAQLLLAPTQARPQLAEQFATERVQEVEEVTTQGRVVEVEFEGQLQSVAGDRWVIAGITVLVTGSTEIEGAPAIGAFAEVHGASQPDGTVLASQIEIEGPHITATSLPPTAAPTPTPRPSETATKAAEHAPSATESPEPSEPPEASRTPELNDDGGDHTPEPDETLTPEADDDDQDGGDNSNNTSEPDND